MKHSIQICTQDKENMKKYTQQSSSGPVPTYCMDVAIIIKQKNFCLTWYHSWVVQPRLSYLRKFFVSLTTNTCTLHNLFYCILSSFHFLSSKLSVLTFAADSFYLSKFRSYSLYVVYTVSSIFFPVRCFTIFRNILLSLFFFCSETKRCRYVTDKIGCELDVGVITGRSDVVWRHIGFTAVKCAVEAWCSTSASAAADDDDVVRIDPLGRVIGPRSACFGIALWPLGWNERILSVT